MTEILHKKRPGFVPVLDSVVFDFLWKNFPHVITQGSPTADVIGLCKTILGVFRGPVAQIRANVCISAMSTTWFG